jgi:hypothetical protein
MKAFRPIRLYTVQINMQYMSCDVCAFTTVVIIILILTIITEMGVNL